MPTRMPRAAVRSRYEPIVYEHAPTGTVETPPVTARSSDDNE
jgi:hypothetical protein